MDQKDKNQLIHVKNQVKSRPATEIIGMSYRMTLADV